MKKKTDRRIARTREMLRSALMELVVEKGYEATTVQDILDRANLGRSTFYAHFKDKDELLISGLQHVVQAFDEHDRAARPTGKPQKVERYSPTYLLFKHAAENHRLYKALLGKRGGEVVQRYLYRYATQVLGRHLHHLAPSDKHLLVRRDLLIHYIVSSFLAMLAWWLEHNMPYTAEEINNIYFDLTIPSLTAVLRR